jgi:hypothetical protein
MLRRFPYMRTLATVCILTLTVQVAAPLFASPSTRWGGKSDSCEAFPLTTFPLLPNSSRGQTVYGTS